MYLGSSLLSAGLEVSAPKPQPNFEIRANGQRIFVEAVCAAAGHPLHDDAVPEPVYQDADGEVVADQVPHDLITPRIASAVRAKLDVFDRHRRKDPVARHEACIVVSRKLSTLAIQFKVKDPRSLKDRRIGSLVTDVREDCMCPKNDRITELTLCPEIQIFCFFFGSPRFSKID
jgi:hypothetical protein